MCYDNKSQKKEELICLRKDEIQWGGDFNYIVSKYTPFDKIIENLKKNIGYSLLTEEEIPNLAMHRF